MAEKVKVSAWEWTVWPTLPTPTMDRLRRMAEVKGPDAVHKFHAWRENQILKEQYDPLRYGWEQPPVAIVRQLIAGTYQPGRFGRSVAPEGWKQERTANDIVMLGGNGSGKSDIQAKFGVECLRGGEKREWRAFSQNESTSIRYIQAPTYKYLPPEFRGVKKKGVTVKISYSESTGFSENVFILDNHSAALFPTYKSYEQDRKSVEGGEADLATWDEEAMADLLKTLRFRVHKKGGIVLGGFTPVGGYTSSVAEYLDAATILEVIPARAVVWDWWHRTWSWGEWLLPEDQELVKGCPPGHIPFVLQSGSGAGRRYAVSLPTMFNAYTNVRAIVDATEAGRGSRRVQGEKLAYALERLWGWPTKLARRAFPNFSDVHIVKPERIPPLESLTIWHWADPHGERNWFMNWTGVDAQGVKWTFAEWPDGEIGEWAVPGPKHDGAEGPAQSYGGGKSLNDYKRLIHEKECWHFDGDTMKRGPRAWVVDYRKMDPRPANTIVPSDEEAKTFIMHMEAPVRVNGKVIEEGIEYEAGCSCGVEEGIQWVNNFINEGWNPNAPATPLNMPRWYISTNCPNTIWALKTFTGADGQKGACKDPIDCLKGLSKTDIQHIPNGMLGSYGQSFGY